MADVKKPNFLSDAIYKDTRDYEIRLGSIADDKLPVYLVVRKESGIVEFAHEVLAIVLEWIEHFEEKNHPSEPVPDDITDLFN